MYNGIDDGEVERLILLSEACGKVIQSVAKILRFGWESDNNGKLPLTNRQSLSEEIGHVLLMVELMKTNLDLNRVYIERGVADKTDRLADEYSRHQSPVLLRLSAGRRLQKEKLKLDPDV